MSAVRSVSVPEPKWPAFNHTRGDSPLNPCEYCAKMMCEWHAWATLAIDALTIALKMTAKRVALCDKYEHTVMAAWDRTGDILHIDDPAHGWSDRNASLFRVLIDHWLATGGNKPA